MPPAAIVAGYAVLALALYRPINPLDATRLPRGGIGDPVQMSWFLEWTAQALVHGRNPFQTVALDYPAGVNLAVNTLTPALGVLVAPVTLTLGPVAAFNLLLRLAYVASASSMCFALRRWCSWWPAAIIGGLLYGFGPYAVSQGHANAHLVLLFDPLLPLLFVLLDDLVVRRRSDPRVTGLWLGVIAGVQAMIDLELLAEAVILALVAIGLTAARSVVSDRRRRDVADRPRRRLADRPGRNLGDRAPHDVADRPGRNLGDRAVGSDERALAAADPGARARSRGLAVGAGRLRARAPGLWVGIGRVGRATPLAAAAFVLIAGLGLYELLFGRRHLNGPVQSLQILGALRYDLLSAVVPTSEQAVRTASLARTADGFVAHNLTENGGYLGLAVVVAFGATVWFARRVAVVRAAALLAGIAWVLSLGARLGIDGHRLGVPLPAAVFAHLPLLGSIVAARFALFTDLFVAGVLAVGLDRIHARIRGRTPRQVGGARSWGRAPRRGGCPRSWGRTPVQGGRPSSVPSHLWAATALAVIVGLGLFSVLPAGRITEHPLGWPPRLAATLAAVVPYNGVVLAYPYPTAPYDSAMGWAAQDHIRFRLVGGYATVPGPAGSHAAQTAPDLVASVSVQELLTSDAGQSPYPPPGRALTDRAERRDLLEVLLADDVDVVVDWPIGRDPAAATTLFVHTLGPATWRVGNVLIWRVAPHVHPFRP